MHYLDSGGGRLPDRCDKFAGAETAKDGDDALAGATVAEQLARHRRATIEGVVVQ